MQLFTNRVTSNHGRSTAVRGFLIHVTNYCYSPHMHNFTIFFSFWATVTSNGSAYAAGPLSCMSCLSVLSVSPVCLSVCNVIGVLWPDAWMDQDATWYEGRPQPRRHCVRWGPSSPHGKGHSCRPMSIVAKRSPISVTAELL